MIDKNEFIDEMCKEWPSVIARKEIYKLTGGLISCGHLANCDSNGTGPKNKRKIGKNVGYLRQDLKAWLRRQVK